MPMPPSHLKKNARWHNLLAWGVACCCVGVGREAMAQTNSITAPEGGVLPLEMPKPEGRKLKIKPDDAKDKISREASRNFILIPPHSEDWTRHFQMGAIAALNISAKFHESGDFKISGNDPQHGIYDDGYVRTDDTGNAGGYTGYWGYQKASQ